VPPDSAFCVTVNVCVIVVKSHDPQLPTQSFFAARFGDLFPSFILRGGGGIPERGPLPSGLKGTVGGAGVVDGGGDVGAAGTFVLGLGDVGFGTLAITYIKEKNQYF